MDLVDGTSAANLAKVGVVYHEARKEVHVLAPRLYPIATPGEWILDLGRTKAGGQAGWTSTTRSLGGYILWNGPETTTGNRGRLWSWALTTAELYEEATGTTADGNDLVCEYEGPALASGLQMARWIDLYGEYQPAAGTLSLEVLVDASSIYTGTLTIGSNLSVYGTGTGLPRPSRGAGAPRH